MTLQVPEVSQPKSNPAMFTPAYLTAPELGGGVGVGDPDFVVVFKVVLGFGGAGAGAVYCYHYCPAACNPQGTYSSPEGTVSSRDWSRYRRRPQHMSSLLSILDHHIARTTAIELMPRRQRQPRKR